MGHYKPVRFKTKMVILTNMAPKSKSSGLPAIFFKVPFSINEMIK